MTVLSVFSYILLKAEYVRLDFCSVEIVQYLEPSLLMMISLFISTVHFTISIIQKHCQPQTSLLVKMYFAIEVARTAVYKIPERLHN